MFNPIIKLYPNMHKWLLLSTFVFIHIDCLYIAKPFGHIDVSVLLWGNLSFLDLHKQERS